MYRRSDPRFRRTLNEISHTFESANETAQANIFTFSNRYINPCLSSLGQCLSSCTSSCFPARDTRIRRTRARSRGRAELNFDFYDDWEDDENDGLLGWDNDEYDGLLSTSGNYGTTATQPARQRAISYGTRRDAKSARRKSALRALEGREDPTVIPATSYFGFFGKLTGKLGGTKELRYKPSAADLQEHPGSARMAPSAGGPAIEEEEEEEDSHGHRHHKRNRSMTSGSGATTDSFSSRGDIFPSEDEDDAVPLDDEFAMVLERRTTGSGLEEAGAGKTRKGTRPSAGSRLSSRTMSSRSTRSSKQKGRTRSGTPPREINLEGEPKQMPSMTELRREEERIQVEEEARITKKRNAAHRLAIERGLSDGEDVLSPSSETKLDMSSPLPSPSILRAEKTPSITSPLSRESNAMDETTPFPAFDPPPMSTTASTESMHNHDKNSHSSDSTRS